MNYTPATELTVKIIAGHFFGDQAAERFTREIAAQLDQTQIKQVMDHAAAEQARCRAEQDADAIAGRQHRAAKMAAEGDGWQEVFTNAYEHYRDPFQAERDWEDARAEGEPVSIFGFMY